jgi:3-hydroxyisobutyrate dehydrogenase
MSKRKVGFIGLGMMGAPMVSRLSSCGDQLFVADADLAKQHEISGKLRLGVVDADAVKSLDVLITMLPNSFIVESVVMGTAEKPGWAAQMKTGSTVIDMSSSEPARSNALAASLEKLGLAYLDAPVSGGVGRAEKGSLAILVGGDAAVLERHRNLLALMGSSILHIGKAGSGHAAKALNNYVSAAGLVATAEALHTAERFGIDPSVMTDVLNASSGRSNTSENKVKQFMLSGSFASGFSLHLMNKDLKIAASLAESLGYPMKLGTTCNQIWDAAATASKPGADHTEMYKWLENER